jgi:Calcium-activated chloride channel
MHDPRYLDSRSDIRKGHQHFIATSDADDDFAARFDYCMVLPTDKSGQLSETSRALLNSITTLGFEVFCYFSVDKGEVYVLLKLSLDKLQQYAHETEFLMLLDPDKVKEACEKGNPEKDIKGFNIADRRDITQLGPYEYIYVPYRCHVDQTLYWREYGKTHPFRESVRLKLGPSLLQSTPSSSGSNYISLTQCLHNKTILGFFPLHSVSKVRELSDDWQSYPRLPMPVYRIKEYFGEKIGLYFAFIDHVTSFIFIPAVMGIPLQVSVYVLNDYSAPFLPPFSFIMAIWAIFMLEYWKRRQVSLAQEWGCLEFEVTEQDRPEFRGDYIPSFTKGGQIKYFSAKTARRYATESSILVSMSIALIIAIVAGIYAARIILRPVIGDTNAQTFASIANAVQINLANFLYGNLVIYLNNRENHRTDTQFEDAMITKNFLFQFVNSFTSFFYIGKN